MSADIVYESMSKKILRVHFIYINICWTPSSGHPIIFQKYFRISNYFSSCCFLVKRQQRNVRKNFQEIDNPKKISKVCCESVFDPKKTFLRNFRFSFFNFFCWNCCKRSLKKDSNTLTIYNIRTGKWMWTQQVKIYQYIF